MRIVSADFVVPVAAPPIEDGAVVIDGSRIVAVGTARAMAAAYVEADLERFDGCALMPGFVNCHSHLELTVLRGLLDDLDHDFASWLLRLTEVRKDVLDDQDILDSALAGALEGVKAGVTTFGDIGRWGRAGLAALVSSGLRGVLFQETEFSPDDASAAEDFEALRDKLGRLKENTTGLVEVGISPHSPYTVSPRLFGLISEYAIEHDLNVTIHAAESDAEQELLEKGTGFFSGVYRKFGVEWKAPGLRAVEYLRGTGILAASPLLVHCTKADRSEIGILAETGSKVAHCPKSNAKFGHGIAPLQEFLEAGVTVGLGTDSMVSNNVCDMFEEARFAALAARVRNGADRFVMPAEAVRLSTLGGAAALGLENEVGSIEVGKQADIIAVSLDEVSRRPVNDVESALVFASRASDVRMTMVAGNETYRDGSCSTVDEDRLAARLEEIGEKLVAFSRTARA